LFLLLMVAVFGLVSCEETKNEDVVAAPDRSGAIETSLATEAYKDSTILTVTYFVYKNSQVVASRIVKDTLPGLGTIQSEGTDADGNEITATVPKQYEFYVTVK
jgi:hypothetical protein